MPRRPGRSLTHAAVPPVVAAVALVAAACGSGSGATHAGGPTQGRPVLALAASASAVNGAVPTADVTAACGSSANTFGLELFHTNPLNAKVMKEWGDIIPGRSMAAVGTVAASRFYQFDMPFDHPFGNDLNVDIRLDTGFTALEQIRGTGKAESTPGQLHTELEQGLLPHSGNADLPGFVPRAGDRMIGWGPWIIDCGHDDFHSEIHPLTFIATARSRGNATEADVTYAPYVTTQLYNPDWSLAGKVNDPSRLTAPDTKPLPSYLVAELLRIAHLGPKGPQCCSDELHAPALVAANTTPPPDWQVCAPKGTSGTRLAVATRFVTRPGVTVTSSPDDATGCATFHVTFPAGYQAPEPAGRQCAVSWQELDSRLADSFGPGIDLRKLIESYVPASLYPTVDKGALLSCYDPLQAPDPGTGGGQQGRVDAGQPFPFYGWARVSWTG